MKGNFDSIISSDKPVLIDFYADWCQPCKIQGPIIQEIAREMKDNLMVIKIDVDKNQGIAQRFQVMSIPTLMLFRKGQALWRKAGVVPKTTIIEMIHQHTG